MPKTRLDRVDRHDSGACEPSLLNGTALERSEVVANAFMNRARNLAGANSYEKDLGFSALDFLRKRLESRHEVAWLDLCCGTGRALIQASEAYRRAGLDEGRIKLAGVDLVPMFDSIPLGAVTVSLIAASVEKWNTQERFDLITCVHGLHYIGDKLGLLQKAASWLTADGFLAANLDYGNLRINGRASAGSQIGRDLRRAGFRYARSRRLLTFGTRSGRVVLPYRYLGADDQAGPNYTGQSAIDSYYERAVL